MALKITFSKLKTGQRRAYKIQLHTHTYMQNSEISLKGLSQIACILWNFSVSSEKNFFWQSQWPCFIFITKFFKKDHTNFSKCIWQQHSAP